MKIIAFQNPTEPGKVTLWGRLIKSDESGTYYRLINCILDGYLQDGFMHFDYIGVKALAEQCWEGEVPQHLLCDYLAVTDYINSQLAPPK